VLFGTAALPFLPYPREMTTLHARSLAVSVCALLFGVSHLAAAQDLSRYRDVAFGSSVSAVVAITATNAADVKLVHQRPALIRQLAWRPQYAAGRTIGQSEAAREVTFRFFNDELFSIIVVYEPRLVEGLTNADIIDAVSGVYGPATLTLPSPPPAAAPPRSCPCCASSVAANAPIETMASATIVFFSPSCIRESYLGCAVRPPPSPPPEPPLEKP